MTATALALRGPRDFAHHLMGFFVEPSSPGRWRLLMIYGPFSALMVGALIAALDLKIGTSAVGIGALVVIAWNHPPFAGYTMFAIAPAIVGLERYQVLPVLRPNEALLFVLVAVMAARWLLYSRRVVVQLNRMDLAMVGLVVCGFVFPLLTQFARLRPVAVDDILYSLVFVRLGLLYGLVRYTVRTPGQVRTAIGFSLAAASVLGVVGLMDSLNLLNAAERLNPYFPNAGPLVDDGRGAASIGNPIGFGVYMGINTCLALAMLLGGERPRSLLAVSAGCCAVGVFGSGQIGPSLAFLFGLVALALLTRSTLRLLRWSLPVIVVVSILIAPLVQERIVGFDGFAINSATRESIAATGGQEESRQLFDANPGSSWDVRLYNLRTFFIPEFQEPANVYFGVTPQARVASPRDGEDFIWIESGHLWLIWSGGLPLFVMFFAFVGVGMLTARSVTRSTSGPVGISAAAFFAALMILFVAQTFDPHLTLRGTSDILYPLGALMVTGLIASQHRPTLTEGVFNDRN